MAGTVIQMIIFAIQTQIVELVDAQMAHIVIWMMVFVTKIKIIAMIMDAQKVLIALILTVCAIKMITIAIHTDVLLMHIALI